jgi:hypothetical protein
MTRRSAYALRQSDYARRASLHMHLGSLRMHRDQSCGPGICTYGSRAAPEFNKRLSVGMKTSALGDLRISPRKALRASAGHPEVSSYRGVRRVGREVLSGNRFAANSPRRVGPERATVSGRLLSACRIAAGCTGWLAPSGRSDRSRFATSCRTSTPFTAPGTPVRSTECNLARDAALSVMGIDTRPAMLS